MLGSVLWNTYSLQICRKIGQNTKLLRRNWRTLKFIWRHSQKGAKGLVMCVIRSSRMQSIWKNHNNRLVILIKGHIYKSSQRKNFPAKCLRICQVYFSYQKYFLLVNHITYTSIFFKDSFWEMLWSKYNDASEMMLN